MKMMTENKQQGRLRHYIGAPRRFLRRARDLYVDSLVSIDSKVSIVTCPTTHAPLHLPKKKLDKEEDLEQLYRSISNKYNWSSMEFDGKPCLKETVGGYGVMDRSYSIALGKIGRIDEEEPCQFHEKEDTMNMFPRSRSHAVTRNNGFYY